MLPPRRPGSKPHVATFCTAIITLSCHDLAKLHLPLPPLSQCNLSKDLTCLGRDLCDTIIVDNSPHAYVFQPECALPIPSFYDDACDQVGLCYRACNKPVTARRVHCFVRSPHDLPYCAADRSAVHFAYQHAAGLEPATAPHWPFLPPPHTQELRFLLPRLLQLDACPDVRAVLGPLNVPGYPLLHPQPPPLPRAPSVDAPPTPQQSCELPPRPLVSAY